MPFDDHTPNFAYSLVATAPSPATTGTSLVVTAGQGALFPTPPFNATIWPASTQPLKTNAEIVRVTKIATDTLTIKRAQESSSARTVIVGDQIAATVTAKTLTDVEALGSPDLPFVPFYVARDNVIPASSGIYCPESFFELGGVYGRSTDYVGQVGLGTDNVYARLVTLPANATITEITLFALAAGLGGTGFAVNGNIRAGVYADAGGAPANLLYSIAPKAVVTTDLQVTFVAPNTVVDTPVWVAFQVDTAGTLVATSNVLTGGFIKTSGTLYATGLPDPFGTTDIPPPPAFLVDFQVLVGGMVELGTDALLEIA